MQEQMTGSLLAIWLNLAQEMRVESWTKVSPNMASSQDPGSGTNAGKRILRTIVSSEQHSAAGGGVRRRECYRVEIKGVWTARRESHQIG